MDGKSVSDADLLDMLQGFNKTEDKTENTCFNAENEIKQSNEDGDYKSQKQSKETVDKDNGKENLEMSKPVKIENLIRNAETLAIPENVNKTVGDMFTSEDATDNAAEIHVTVTPNKLEGNAAISASMQDVNNNSYANISLHVNEAEFDMFNDCNEEKKNDQKDDVDVSKEVSVQTDTKGVKRIPESQLHCGICNNYLETPKLLICLHSFCQSCLMKNVESCHKFIFCMVCAQRSCIPKGGIKKLPDNIVASSLIQSKLEEERLAECMICKIHNVVNTATGQCLDCGDVMCTDCSKNHTFSRITAKHVVVTFEQTKSEPYAKSLKNDIRNSFCTKHSDKTGEFFCLVCCLPVCKECKQTGHRSHRCDRLEVAVAGKRELLKNKLDTLRLECATKLVDDTDESRSLIIEHRKKEFEKLKGARDELVAIIEKKYSKCLKNLQEEYEIKTNKYCKHKKILLKSLSENVVYIEEFVLFLLNEGNDLNVAILENSILNALEDQRIYLGKLRPKLTNQNSFPEVKIFKKHAEVIEDLTFFCSNLNYLEQKRKDYTEKLAQSEMYLVNADTRRKVSKKFKN